jgi:hypothetical protein
MPKPPVASSSASETLMERVLERCLKLIETRSVDGSGLFFPDGIALIRIGAKASAGAPNFDFEITIAGPTATTPKPLAATGFALTAFGRVQQACEDLFEANHDDCNKFAKAVAGNFGINLTGNADDIVAEIQQAPWNYIGNDLTAASQAADFAGQDKLVIGGLTSTELGDTNGHVVVVVPGDLVNGKYPVSYWGSITTGKEGRNKGVSYAFQHPFCDTVHYGWIQI